MRTRGPAAARAAVAITIAVGGYMVGLEPLGGNVGVTLAEAKQFYTRKRVNGRWITGVFPKGLAGLRRSYARLDPDPDDAEIPMPPPREPAAAIASAAASLFDPVDTTAALAMPRPVAPEPGQDEQRLLKLREALHQRASEIMIARVVPAEQAAAPVAAVPAPPAKIQAAIPASGAIQAAPAASARVSPASPAQAGALEPKSVSYDFETGVKTTVYAASVVREPFDVAFMKRIAVPVR